MIIAPSPFSSTQCLPAGRQGEKDGVRGVLVIVIYEDTIR
jgi:hypothetical protein